MVRHDIQGVPKPIWLCEIFLGPITASILGIIAIFKMKKATRTSRSVTGRDGPLPIRSENETVP